MGKLENTIINDTKCLALDMINVAGSGHPGVALGAAEIFYSIYSEELNYKRNIPKWMNRDRFVVSAGHASALLYATLFMNGFDLSVNDLKEFRKLNSSTPGHPEYGHTNGVEATTGPLGQGVAMSVGMALAERYYESLVTNIKPKSKLVDYYTYCFCGDGDLMEGVAYEALSFAGTQKLNKLILLYDNNSVTLDGKTDATFTEDVETRFEAMGFNTFKVKKVSVERICDAIDEAKKSKKPSIIIINTIIGKDSRLEGTNAVHGHPLAKEDLISIKNKLKHSLEPFNYDEQARMEVIRNADDRNNKVYKKWLEEYEEVRSLNNSKLNELIDLMEQDSFKVNFDVNNFKIADNYHEELRISNHKIMNFIAKKTPYLVGGSADLSSSNMTNIAGESMNSNTPLGKNIFFGVREHAMGAILNGMALSGLRVFSSTFLAFSDYMLPAMRMGALMDLPVTYIFTHDSIKNSSDGPTHEPVEELSSLRLIPNMITLRPCDINEVLGSWDYIMKNSCPVSLVISKNKMPKFKNTNAKYVKYGAYMIRKEKYRLDGIIISTGDDVEKSMEIADDLFNEGIDLRVVSMPSMELFLKQNPKYEEQLLPKNVKTFVIETGSSIIWNRFATNSNYIFGVDKFGKSGDMEGLMQEMGLDSETIKRKIKENL